MATGAGNGRTPPQAVPQASHRGAPAPNLGTTTSPPSRRELASWWKKFRKTTEKGEEKVNTVPGIFGVPLAESIRYANVAISLTNEQGESFIYGYVPIVVAKCGVFLKEKATDVEGIFRLSGSAKRIKDLQAMFNSPDRYGKGLDWTGYTVHDAANILRRYLNQLPEPIVPLVQYERFRDPLRAYQQQLEGQVGNQTPEISATDHANAVTAYQKLITELPALNRQLLLYILDLLAVFASKSDVNRMTAANLAAIFQPGIISHPVHDMAPQEYRLSQDVLIFLIENQDNFLIGMTGTGLDEKTQKDVESGAPSLKSPKANIGRSASNASAGADSLRKFGIRRNVSTSSRASKERTSPNVSSPATPSTPSYGAGSAGIGVARSNTVPSKRSPAVAQHRFQRPTDSGTPSSPAGPPPAEGATSAVTPERRTLVNTSITTTPTAEPAQAVESAGRQDSASATAPFPDVPVSNIQPETQPNNASVQQSTLQVPNSQQASNVQTRDRKKSNFFTSKSPIFGPSDGQQSPAQRQPRKLQKRQRLPGSMIESAQSSAASLPAEDPFHTPLVSPDLSHSQTDPLAVAAMAQAVPTASPVRSATEQSVESNLQSTPPSHDTQNLGRSPVPQKSPAASLRSGASMTDPSDFDALEDPTVKAEKKKSRWRFSSSARKTDDYPLVPPPPIGQIPGARTSNSSLGSSGRPRQSFTAESQLAQQVTTDPSTTSQPSILAQSSQEFSEAPKEGIGEAEKRGFLGKWKAKMTQAKEERREREAEKERARSPPRVTGEHATSRNSLSAFAHEHFSPRGRSFDRSREEVLPAVNERARVPSQNAGQPMPPVGVQTPSDNLAVRPAPATTSPPVPTSGPVDAPKPAAAAVPSQLPAAVSTTGTVAEPAPESTKILSQTPAGTYTEPTLAETSVPSVQVPATSGPGPAVAEPVEKKEREIDARMQSHQTLAVPPIQAASVESEVQRQDVPGELITKGETKETPDVSESLTQPP